MGLLFPVRGESKLFIACIIGWRRGGKGRGRAEAGGEERRRGL